MIVHPYVSGKARRVCGKLVSCFFRRRHGDGFQSLLMLCDPLTRAGDIDRRDHPAIAGAHRRGNAGCTFDHAGQIDEHALRAAREDLVRTSSRFSGSSSAR